MWFRKKIESNGNSWTKDSKRAFLRTAAVSGMSALGASSLGRAAQSSTLQSSGTLPGSEGDGIEVIDTFANLLSGELKPKSNIVQTLGFQTVGDIGGGRYQMSKTRIYEDSFKDSVGNWWTVIPDSRILNVRQFGAAGNGINDDTNAIHRAMQRLRRSGSAVVYFPAGKYLVSEPLLHYDREDDLGRIKILGDGAELTQFVLDGEIENFLFRIQGDTSAYSARHVRFVDFENFGIRGNGADRQNLFEITCADRVNFRSVHAFDFVGVGIKGRQWWDSLCDVRFVRGGDDKKGREAAVIDLDLVFESNLSNSACNNIIFSETTQIEAYRWMAMRWGRSTRRCRFLGKIHGWIGRPYTEPAVKLEGATQNVFLGCAVAHSIHAQKSLYDVLITNTDYIPARNLFLASTFQTGIKMTGEVRYNVITNCVFLNDTEPAVWLERGRGNIVKDNVFSKEGTEVYAERDSAVEPD